MSNYTVNGVTFTARRESNELQHFGVKGMKWGRRKTRPTALDNIRRAGGVKAIQRDAKKALAREKASMTPAQKKRLRRMKAGIASTVALGSAATAAAVVAIGNKKASQMAQQAASGANAMKHFMSMTQTGPLSFTIEDRYTPFGNILGL